MSPLVKALEKISDWIENSNSKHAEKIRGEYAYHLVGTPIELNEFTPQPGIEREMLELYAEEINFKLSEEIYELFEWHNGRFMIGDEFNPFYFIRFEDGFCHYAQKLRSFPIFEGDELHYFVNEATNDLISSPIYIYDGNVFEGNRNNYEDYFAPSITSYMQAMAECIETYGEISIGCSDYYSQRRKYTPLFCLIYEKYGVNTEGNVIWG